MSKILSKNKQSDHVHVAVNISRTLPSEIDDSTILSNKKRHYHTILLVDRRRSARPFSLVFETTHISWRLSRASLPSTGNFVALFLISLYGIANGGQPTCTSNQRTKTNNRQRGAATSQQRPMYLIFRRES